MPVMIQFHCRLFYFMNLSGHWSFCENFDFGCDYGIAVLRQKGNIITGTFVYVEHIFDEGEFTISVDVRGSVFEDQIAFEGIACRVIDPVEEAFEYYFDDRTGVIVDYDRIEGTSDDDQGVEVHFTLIRLA